VTVIGTAPLATVSDDVRGAKNDAEPFNRSSGDAFSLNKPVRNIMAYKYIGVT
jgi:hypothetical protein